MQSQKRKVVKQLLKKILLRIQLSRILFGCKSKKILYVGSPLHGNIGDHAISIATMEILKKYGLPVVEIPGAIFSMFPQTVIKHTNFDDIVILTGGGFIGSLWLNEQDMVKKVIKSFPKNKIVVMPQTYYFSNDEIGNKELNEFRELVDNHHNVFLCAREKNSYDFCKRNFVKAKDVVLLPDIALSIHYNKQQKREGVLLVFRNDKEKSINVEKIKEIFKNIEIKETTTVVNNRINIKRRERIFEKKLNEFCESKLVITDRLHGMIFSAITATPCIAFDNKSKKVSGVYKWINTLKYIKFCDDISNVFDIYNQLDLQKRYKYELGEKFTNQINDFLSKIIK